jgi:flagellar biosynthesis protein FlhB
VEQKGDVDRNEPASEFKLEKARKQGSVARSGDMTFAAVLIAAVACIYGLAQGLASEMAMLLGRGLRMVHRSHINGAALLAYAESSAVHAVLVLAPVAAIFFLSALVVAGVQARGTFALEPVKPDFSRLSPATGIERLLSIKSLHELWRTVAKLGLMTTAIVLWGQSHLGEMLRLQDLQSDRMVLAGVRLLGSAATLLAGIVGVLAMLDFAFNRWDFRQRMRMSKREVKDEHKEREGDPRIKSRLRELRLEWLKRARQLANVRSADVLLTNPTHCAVALEYRPGEMPAPQITARGAGDLARRMRAEARRRSIPIVEQPVLTRALFALDDTRMFVPEEHFASVARILRWVYSARAHDERAGAAR